MTIYALGGVSGTGKTHFRTTCDCLRGLRTLDIADVYEDSRAEGTPDLHWKTALERFAGRVRGLLEEDSSSDLVLEAFFRPDGDQRRVIASLAQTYGIRVRWAISVSMTLSDAMILLQKSYVLCTNNLNHE